MPAYRKKVYRRRYPAKKGTVVRKVAKQEVKRALKKEIETKFTDFTPNGVPVSIDRVGTLTQYQLYVGTRGTTADTYIGERIAPKGLYLRCHLSVKSTSTLQSTPVRIFLVQMKDNSAPFPSQLLLNTGADWQSPVSQLSRDYTSRYRLLYDRVHMLTPGNEQGRFVHIFIPANKLRQIRYTAAGAVESGNILFNVVGPTNTAGDEPTLLWSGRLYYTDA